MWCGGEAPLPHRHAEHPPIVEQRRDTSPKRTIVCYRLYAAGQTGQMNVGGGL
jgi:hypothetical protein